MQSFPYIPQFPELTAAPPNPDAGYFKFYKRNTGDVYHLDSAGTSTGLIQNGGNSYGAPLTLGTNDAQAVNIETSGVNRMSFSAAGDVAISQGAQSSGTNAAITVTQAAHTGGVSSVAVFNGSTLTGQTATNEIVDIYFNLARTVTRNTGAVTTQRAFLIQAPTYSFSGASVITTAATLAISGAPIAGTNATITNSYALWIQGGGMRYDVGSDATGDLHYRDANGRLQRLGIGTSGQVLTVASGLPSWAAAGGGSSTISTLFTASATATVSNTTTETTLMGSGVGSKTIGANTLSAGSVIRITVSGSVTTTGSPNINIRVKIGSTTILTTNTNNIGSLSGTRQFRLTCDLTFQTIGGSGTVIGTGSFTFSSTSSIVTTLWELEASGGNGTTSTIDTTVAGVVDVTAQWGTASASNTIAGYNVSIEKLN